MIKLFEEFEPVKKSEWLQKATDDMKGNDPFELYVKSFGEGIKQMPYYDSSDKVASVSENIAALMHDRPYNRWYNTQEITITEEKIANQLALKALEAGATGLHFVNKLELPNLQTLLHNIKLPYIYTCFSGFNENIIRDYIQHEYNSEERQDLVVGIADEASSVHDFATTDRVNFPGEIRDFFLTLDDHNSDTFVKSIAELMSRFVDFITKSDDENVQNLFDRVIIQNFCNHHYFFEIAKLRALRILFAEIGAYYNVDSPKVFIQSTTTKGDDHLDNLLTNTTQAMAAITGGTDAIIVTPHLGGTASGELSLKDLSFTQRIARNVSNLIDEESHFGKVLDPAAGSWYVTNLTQQIVDRAWQKFTDMEELGGYAQKSQLLA